MDWIVAIKSVLIIATILLERGLVMKVFVTVIMGTLALIAPQVLFIYILFKNTFICMLHITITINLMI